MSRLKDAIDQICAARRYTTEMLKHVDARDWFRQPTEGVTHIAWQVGHLAVAQYGLALKRVRGERAEDVAFLSIDFRQRFGKGSVPQADAAAYPAIEEIRRVFDEVHRRVLDELGGLEESVLDEATDPPPHPMFQTKESALRWCAQHEFVHVGQIALLRRLLGGEPVR